MAISRASNTVLLFLNTAVIIRRVESSSAAPPKTKNYIDTISGYDELSACAVEVLSTVVRDENSGCQDTYALTSYTCFCTDSSSYFSNVISRDVVSGCNSSIATPQATSALSVFDAYCALGVAAGLVTTQICKSTGTRFKICPGPIYEFEQPLPISREIKSELLTDTVNEQLPLMLAPRHQLRMPQQPRQYRHPVLLQRRLLRAIRAILEQP